jgi:hypothetical protein
VQPVWLTVTTGFGSTDTRDQRRFCSVGHRRHLGDGITVAFAKGFLEDGAANVAADEHPSPEEQR